MRAVNESDAKQMWVTSQFGQQIINVGTNLPLQAGNGRTWSYNQTEMILKDDRSPHKALTRGWAKKDGVHVVTWDKTKDLIVQLFIKQTREERTGLSGRYSCSKILNYEKNPTFEKPYRSTFQASKST